MNAPSFHEFRNWAFRLSKYHTIMVTLFIHTQFIGGITNPPGRAHVCNFFLLLAFFFTPCKAEQQLGSKKSQEKEEEKDEKIWTRL